MGRTLLVVGARPGSLGAWVATTAKHLAYGEPWEVVTAGISGEDVRLDVDWSDEPMTEVLREHGPFSAVVCTAGINPESCKFTDGNPWHQRDAMDVNFMGHMSLLWNWVRYWHQKYPKGVHDAEWDAVPPLSWVSISSNSAHIARTKSLMYCASKAALSMGIRCAGRELAGGRFSIYGYEPGWLDGTPMSEAKELELATDSTMPGDTKLHRIPGGQGVDPISLAGMIVGNLNNDRALNGCMLRVDGGEQ